MKEKLKDKLDDMWEEHWKDKHPRDFKNRFALADFERELEIKIWKQAQKELLDEILAILRSRWQT